MGLAKTHITPESARKTPRATTGIAAYGGAVTPGRRAVIAALSVNLMSVLPLFLTGAMAVQISRDLGVSAASIAILASLFAVASMSGSAPLGRQVRRLGVRRSLRVTSSFSAAALLLASLAPSVWFLGGAMLLAGIGNSLGQPAGNSLVAAQVNPKRYGLGFAIKQSAIPVATTLGGLAVPIVALTVGWRAAYVVAAFAALAAMLLIPADRMRSAGRSESPVPSKLLRPLWGLAAGMAAAVFAATSIGALGAAGGVHVGLSEASAGYLVAAGGIAGLAIRLGSGVVADRVPFDSLRAVAVLVLVGGFGWLSMATDRPVAFAIGLVVANAFGWGWPGLQHLSMARRFPTATAAASGISQTGVAAGLFLGPAILGLIVTTVGWSWSWLAAATAAFIGAAVVWIAAGRIPQNHEEPG